MIMRRALASVAAVLLSACPGSTNTKPSSTSVSSTKNESSVSADETQKPSLAQAFAAECGAGLAAARSILPRLIAVNGPRTIENTLEVFNDMVMSIERSASTASLMSAVHPDEAIREAARACEREVDAYNSQLRLNRDLYEIFAGLDTSSYDAESKRLVEHTLRDFRRAGVDRDEATRTRLRDIDEQLSKSGQEFQKNIVDDVRYISLQSVEQLAGLPADFVRSHPQSEQGEIKISTDYPDYYPFMSYAESPELRKALYVAFKARGDRKNEPVLAQILTLRAEKARLLGYENWADYVTEDKMMKSGKNAAEFIERVVKITRKRADKDYKELLARKRKDVPRATVVEDYEKTYYENRVKAESYAFDPQSVRPHFPYELVEAGLLAITSELYDITYKRVQDAPVWHQDVKVFDVMRGDSRLGRIFLDMHPREGKYKHAAQLTYRSGVAGKQLPEGVLVCNFPNPRASEGPALMEHGEVVTMFHEFGHLMHHVLGGHKRWIGQSGVATEWDFVEAPSQMFEEWAWSHDTLETFAKHYETGAPISKDMVERMRRAEKFGLGLATLQQMFYASVSLELHTADPATLDMPRKIKQLQTKYTPFPFVEGTAMHANFGHLNGYSAIYYTYMWSLVIAKDLLTPFKEHGLMNTEWTYRYRDRILAPGGSSDAAVLVRDFLGREYSFKAFEEYLGG